MKKIIIILALIFVSTKGYTQNDEIRGNQFELTGKIIKGVELTPHCGTIAWGTVIEFEIIKFSKPNYALDTIGIIFMCPEFYKEGFFEVGKTYTITVADENPANFGWAIPNESKLNKYKLDKKLWVIKAEKKES